MYQAAQRTAEITNRKHESPRPHIPVAALLFATSLAACSGGGGGGFAPSPADDSDPTVTETLQALNIDTQEKPLKDENGEPLPEDYSPLGATHELNKISELVVLGIAPQGSPDRLTLWDLDQNPKPTPEEPSPEYKGPVSLTSVGSAAAPWAHEQGDFYLPTTTRSGMAADLDGDGCEEQVYAHFDTSSMWFTIIEDGESGYERDEFNVFLLPETCYDVNVASADIDGDGDQEIVLGYSLPYQAILEVFDYEDAAVVTEPLIRKTFDPQVNGANLLMIEMASGNMDRDSREELGLVVTEIYGYTGPHWWGEYFNLPQLDGCTTYVLDDVETGLAVLAKTPLKAVDDYGISQRALTGDVDVGDLDADGLDEVVFAGSVDPLHHNVYGSNPYYPAKYVLSSLDDAAHDLADLGTDYFELTSPGDIRWAQIDLLDLEADHACEVHVNEFVFSDWIGTGPWFSKGAWKLEEELSGFYATYPMPTMFDVSPHFFDPSMFDFAVADFTGDFRQDLAVVSHGGNEVAIWGIDAHDPQPEFRVLDRVPFDYGYWSSDRNPQLIPVNADSDSRMLEFIDRQYVMSEPVVRAVLAAAPSIGAPGTNPAQNVGANQTEFGQSKGSGSSHDHELSLSVGISVGSEDPLFDTFDIEANVKTDYQHVWSSSYAVTNSLSYATGWEEDTVIATVVPYDVYRYRVVMDPQEELIGQVVRLMIPRKSINVQVERDYFNSVIGADSIQIDESVLPHTIGAPASYIGKQEALDKLDLTPGMISPNHSFNGYSAVSQQTQTIAVSKDTGHSAYVGVTAEFSVETNVGGVTVGGSVGAGTGHTWGWSTNQETSYSGTVGSVAPEDSDEKAFTWGLFCNWHTDPKSGQTFQVINYWVELGAFGVQQPE